MAEIIDDDILCDILMEYDELSDFYEFDIDSKEFQHALSQIEKLSIKIKRRDTLTDETLKQLSSLLDHMKSLKELRMINYNINERRDVSLLLSHISSKLEHLSLDGFDLSDGVSQERLQQLKEIKYFSIDRCNIPYIPHFSKEGCRIILGANVTGISDRDCVDFGTNPEIKNELITQGNAKVSRILGALKGKPLPLDVYEKYKEFIPRFGDIDICISIKDVSQLNLEQLKVLRSNKRIKYICIDGGCYKDEDKYGWYSLDEYMEVRTEIDKIISLIKVPNKEDPNRDKKTFAQVYKLLGKRIRYDYYAIDDINGKIDINLQHNCRNMKNGLIGIERDGKRDYLSVCAGYADILRNVLACFSIEGEYVRSNSDVQLEFHNGAYEEMRDENGKLIYRNGTTDPMGHAYNLVCLDGKYYYCDLTWDADNIKVDRFPLWNFLNSYEHFAKSHGDVGFYAERADKRADYSLPFDEQLQLFGEMAKEEIMQMLQENYLSGFVAQYLNGMEQCKAPQRSKEFLKMLEVIKAVEETILYRGANRKANMGIKIGDRSFYFETSDSEKLVDMKGSIQKRRKRECGHESR